MQIIIPMSGFGERFRKAGHRVPKPLIEIDGRPIISYVIDLFPGADSFIFVCNEEHLAEPAFRMSQILQYYAPGCKIVAIKPHRLGPVHAVLESKEYIDPNIPTIINYCDFTCYWDFDDFRTFLHEIDCDGAIPAYKGFHPHSLGSTYYAYMKTDGMRMLDIQEKQPFSDQPMEEYASSGTYYFKTGALCLETLSEHIQREELTVGGEFYVSLSYKILLERSKTVAVYPLQHFMQWGTPQDVETYKNWSKTFRHLVTHGAERGRQDGALVVPMAGLGQRFAKEGYTLTKPLIFVSGRPMVIQATNDLPSAPINRFILRKDIPDLEKIVAKLRSSFVSAELVILEELTEGQAVSALHGIRGLSADEPVTIAACDNGLLFDPDRYRALLCDPEIDVIVWTFRGHPEAKNKPEMFGWVIETEMQEVSSVLVKEIPPDPTSDAMIVGTFTFKRAADYIRCAESLLARDGRINNEFYIDSLLKDALDIGLTVVTFNVDSYVGWGTPNDLKTFEYWQSCFHKWNAHPYKIEKDARVPVSQVSLLEDQYKDMDVMATLGLSAGSPDQSRFFHFFNALRSRFLSS